MTEEFKDNKFDITLTRKPDCVVEMKITATPEAAKESYEQAIKNIGKEVSFPGFRKGRAPKKMILSQYGSQVEREFKELLLNQSVRKALELSKTAPWNQSEKIKADIEEASQEKGGRFTVEFESLPQIPEVEPSDIEVKKIEPKEIADEDVDKHIRSLQYHNAEWEEVSDREVRDDDFVDVTIKADGNERHGSFHVNKEHVEEWLYDFFVGKKIGETAQTTPPKPEIKDEGAPEPKQNPIEITVDKIRVPKLDEIDDEFAKKFGAVSAQDLKKKVREYLERQEKEQAKNRLHAIIQDKLSETYAFDIPATLKESEKANILNQLIDNYKRQQYSAEEIEKVKGKLEEIAEQRALVNVRTHYILLKVSEEQQFKVGREELMQELIHQSMKPDGTMDMDMVNNPDKHSGPIIRRLQMIKAMEYLADHVKIS